MQVLCNLLKIDYPIVQAPMLGVTTAEMVAAVSNAGGLGSLPVGGLSPDKTRDLIRATKALTNKPFAVNLFAHASIYGVGKQELDNMQHFLAEVCEEFHVPFEPQDPDTFKFYYYRDQLDVLLKEQVSIVSFTFGELDRDSTNALKQNGVVLIGTATSVTEAKVLERSGVDAITVQGIEAGGHRGTFLHDDALPQIGLMALLPQVVESTTLPALAAGAICDAQTMKAAFDLGAAGVQIGSLFIAAIESMAADVYKECVLNSTDTSTELTRAFSGRWARGIRNAFMVRMEEKNISIPYYTYQNQLMSNIRAYAQKNNISELIAMWVGQRAGRAEKVRTDAIITRLIKQLPDSYV